MTDDGQFCPMCRQELGGPSRRDVFAALVMAGLAQCQKGPQVTADIAVEFADALLARLDKEPTDG